MNSEVHDNTFYTVFCIHLLPASCIEVLALSCTWRSSVCVLSSHCSRTLAIGRQFLTMEACVRYDGRPCGICGGQSGSGTGFSPLLQFHTHTSPLCILALGRLLLDALEAEVLTDNASSYTTNKEKCPFSNKFHIRISNRWINNIACLNLLCF